MKAELTDKDRMLSMYENSMADLNSKMHLLKKSIEEKVWNSPNCIPFNAHLSL